jgi:hypothetical protein
MSRRLGHAPIGPRPCMPCELSDGGGGRGLTGGGGSGCRTAGLPASSVRERVSCGGGKAQRRSVVGLRRAPTRMAAGASTRSSAAARRRWNRGNIVGVARLEQGVVRAAHDAEAPPNGAARRGDETRRQPATGVEMKVEFRWRPWTVAARSEAWLR